MKIKILGSAASEGFPALFCECGCCQTARRLGGRNLRTRASALVDDTLLIDFSPDTCAHTLFGGLDLSRVEHLLITHSHQDHYYPTDLFTAFPPMAQRPDTRGLMTYGDEKTGRIFWQELASYRGGAYMRPEYRRALDFTTVHAGDEFRAGAYTVLALPARHDPSEECLLYCVERDGARLLHAHDTATLPDEAWRLLSGRRMDCVVLDCTSTVTDEPFAGHMNFRQNIETRETMLRLGLADERTVFIATHFVHANTPPHDALEALFSPHHIRPAYDGMEVAFGGGEAQ